MLLPYIAIYCFCPLKQPWSRQQATRLEKALFAKFINFWRIVRIGSSWNADTRACLLVGRQRAQLLPVLPSVSRRRAAAPALCGHAGSCGRS